MKIITQIAIFLVQISLTIAKWLPASKFCVMATPPDLATQPGVADPSDGGKSAIGLAPGDTEA